MRISNFWYPSRRLMGLQLTLDWPISVARQHIFTRLYSKRGCLADWALWNHFPSHYSSFQSLFLRPAGLCWLFQQTRAMIMPGVLPLSFCRRLPIFMLYIAGRRLATLSKPPCSVLLYWLSLSWSNFKSLNAHLKKPRDFCWIIFRGQKLKTHRTAELGAFTLSTISLLSCVAILAANLVADARTASKSPQILLHVFTCGRNDRFLTTSLIVCCNSSCCEIPTPWKQIILLPVIQVL